MIREEPRWWTRAACQIGKHYLLFFPQNEGENKKARVIRERKAVNICWSCPVRTECQAYGVEREPDYGIWGGLTARQLKQLVEDVAA